MTDEQMARAQAINTRLEKIRRAEQLLREGTELDSMVACHYGTWSGDTAVAPRWTAVAQEVRQYVLADLAREARALRREYSRL